MNTEVCYHCGEVYVPGTRRDEKPLCPDCQALRDEQKDMEATLARLFRDEAPLTEVSRAL